MADFELLAPGGHQKLVDEVEDRLDFKADIDGYYAQLTAGAADNLTARGDAVEASFIRRTSGGIADIESGNATIKSIKGNTIRWNQLFKPYVRSTSADGVSYSCDADGKVTMTGTATAANSFTLNRTTEAPSVVNGHKYLLTGGDATAGVSISIGNLVASSYGGIITSTNDGIATAAIKFAATFTGTYVCYPQLFDLTAMFGAGNEPETVAEFEAMYPEPYYAYDAGSLKPVKLNGIETTGFNQWDEEWEVGNIDNATGQNTSSSSIIRSKNYVPILPSTSYYYRCSSASGANLTVFYYDSEKNFISLAYLQNTAAVSPSNAQYLRFKIGSAYGTTYNHDICLNLSWSGRRNGEYEPYWKAERLIALGTYFPTGLKKAGTVYDELTATEAIQRVGVVDLGSLTWIVAATGSTGQYRMVSNGLRSLALKPASNAVLADITCQKYDVHTSTEVYQLNVGICIDATGDIVVYDPNYATQDSAAAFKTAMSGVTLYYALATPTTTAIDPALNLTYKVDDWGTETITGPLGAAPDMDIIYGMNAVDTIRRLPDLYAGKAETEAALAGKADVDGYYSQMTVGAADNLTGRGDATTAEFLYRTAGGTADIETGQAVAKSIKGNTLRWNQLQTVRTNTSGSKGITFAEDGTGAVTVSGTSTASGVETSFLNLPWPNPIPAGHKILFRGCPAGGSASTYYLRNGYMASSGTFDTGNGMIVTNGESFVLQINVFGGVTVDNLVFRPQLFDLTQMFGAGNEPTTVAEFEAMFPEPYYEYDAGSLLSVNMEGIETVGFNQWDEVWEVGSIDPSTGENAYSTATIRSKNYISVFPATQYYFQCATSNFSMVLFFYDADKNLLSSQTIYSSRIVITPDSCHFMRFRSGSYGNTYKGDICINLSWSGRRNGEYEPYWSAQREIAASTYFPDGMRSAGTVRDELTSTEAIQRVGAVDLGSLTWEASSTTGSFNSNAINAANKANASVAKAICTKYNIASANSVDSADNRLSIGLNNQTLVRVHDTAYTDAASFKAAMSGVMLYYELATPTVTPIDPPLNLSYRVDDFGTERVMVPEDERSAPPVLDIAYGLNVVDFVRRAPTEYISAASFRQYLLARDAHDGTTTTMTWDDTDNRYEFAITDNASEG